MIFEFTSIGPKGNIPKLVKFSETRTLNMSIEELNKRKTPIVTIDNSLSKYKELPIFQDKVDKANEMLRTIGLPKGKKNVKLKLKYTG